MYDILELNQKLLAELRDIAKGLKIKRVESFKKQDLIYKILDAQAIAVSESKTSKKEGGRGEASKKPSPRKAVSKKEPEVNVAAAEAPAESKTPQRKKPGRPPKKEKKPIQGENQAGGKPAENTVPAEQAGLTSGKASGEAAAANAPAAANVLSTNLHDLLSRSNKGGSLELAKIKQAVRPMVDSVIRNPDACIWLARMKQEDDYIYEHSLGTSIWAVALGRQLGLPKSDLHSLAIGGLLFDIGKLKLSKDLLKASRDLTAKELKIMKRHVEVGVKLLKEDGMTNQNVIDMAAHHHERHNGKGYPQGLVGNEIPVFARIAAIVDCYDAITSDRIYAKAISSSQAIKLLYDWKDIDFQGELVEEFIQAIGIYPAGTLVELSSGEVAIVVAESRSRRLRPQLMLILDRDKQPLGEIEYIDLLEVTETEDGKPLNIVNSLEPNAYGIDMNAIEL